jgi:hypothetical protein
MKVRETVIDQSESQLLAPAPAPNGMVHQPAAPTLEHILMTSIERGATPEAIDKLLAVYERMQGLKAKREFSEAMSEFKRSCPPVARRTISSQFKVRKVDNNGVPYESDRRYAALEDIEETIRGPLGDHGLSFRWGTAIVDAGKLTLSCIISHIGGHEEASSVTLPLDSKAGCSEAQKYGAVMTYAQRYSLIAALGLTSCDDDNDGRGPGGAPEIINANQVANLSALIDEVGADRAKFLAWLEVERLEDLPLARFNPAVKALEDKRRKGK